MHVTGQGCCLRDGDVRQPVRATPVRSAADKPGGGARWQREAGQADQGAVHAQRHHGPPAPKVYRLFTAVRSFIKPKRAYIVQAEG